MTGNILETTISIEKKILTKDAKKFDDFKSFSKLFLVKDISSYCEL